MMITESNEQAWLAKLVGFSKYGSLLPVQVALLKQIFYSFREATKRVTLLVAPPASGKTHVICLLASYLNSLSRTVALVVPNDYLKVQFEEE